MPLITRTGALLLLLLGGLTFFTRTPSNVAETQSPSLAPTQTPSAAPSLAPTQTPSAAPATDLSSDEINAIEKALDYLDYSSFSRKGLIDQLVYEGFSKVDAQFAVDFIEVDWFEQAVLTAENYLEFSSFSRKGLIDQLMYEGFTRAQAEYGVSEAY
jgi:hypothetical protein